jgi:hypothetical protein
MNLIDTIGMETIQEETSEEIASEVTPKVKKESKEAGKEVEKESKEVGKEVEKESKEAVKEVETESKEVIKEVGTESKETIKEVRTESKEAGKEVETESRKAVKEVVKESKEVMEVERESKGVVKEEVKEIFINESPSASIYNFSEESDEDIIYREYDDQETTVVKPSAVKNNSVREKMNRESIVMAEEIINFGETINVAESLVLSFNKSNKSSVRNKRYSRTKIDSGYSENSISTKNVKRESRSFERPRSMFSLGQLFSPPSNNNFLPESSRNNKNLNRRSSIHSKKSYEHDVSRRSSVSSKFSINTTTGVMMEEPNEDGFDNIKFRNKFFTDPKRSPLAQKSSNKSLHFLRNLWKSDQNLSLADGGENSLSNKEITERYCQQDDSAKFDCQNRSVNLQRSTRVEGTTTEMTAVSLDTGCSNFYLAEKLPAL